MPADRSVRHALPSDVDAILAIEQASVEAPHWTPAVWQQALAGAVAAVPERAVFVAESGQGIVGFAVVSCAGGVSELENIAVRPELRGQGIGRMLCVEVIAWSRSRAALELELEVRASNDSALRLYRALGFAEQGRRRGYYSAPIDDALLLSLPLQAP